MAKALSIFGLVVAIIVILLFGLDLGLSSPFGGVSKVMDIGLVIAGAILAYLSWSTFREQA